MPIEKGGKEAMSSCSLARSAALKWSWLFFRSHSPSCTILRLFLAQGRTPSGLRICHTKWERTAKLVLDKAQADAYPFSTPMVNEFSAAHELWAAQIEHIGEMFALLSLIWGGSVRITSVQHPQRQHMAHP